MLLLCNRGLQIASALHGFVSPTAPLLGRGDGQQQIEGTAIYLTEILLMRPSRLVRAPSCSALSVPAPRNRTCITGHLIWTGRQTPRGRFSSSQFLCAKRTEHTFVFPSEQWFLKRQKRCFLLIFFNYRLQLFSITFTNYFKSFLGSHTSSSHLDGVQTKQSKKGRTKKFIKITCRLIRFQMVEKSNSS